MMAVSESQSSRNIAHKLHRQFGHPTSEKLIKLVRNAGMNDKLLEKEIINISQQCIYCLQYKRAPPRPVVSMPMATMFNETVSMDLKVWNKYTFLVMVDMATRFCTATVISNKLPSTIIKGIFVCWIAIFGAPKKILTDNGGEFNNGEMKALGESFNIKILSTAAESPWSNGICERLNGVLGIMVSKIVEDAKCDVHTALAWAVSARNAFDNNSGFSPNQLVFGFNPVIPNVFINKLPALEEVTSSEMVRKHLNAKEIAREQFTRCESDERIKRALKSNIRSTEIKDIKNGDDVFYKRNDAHKWHGPGQVIGYDGKSVLVKHGGTYVRAHTTRLAKMPGKIDSDFTKSQDEVSIDDTRSEVLKENEISEVTGPMELVDTDNPGCSTVPLRREDLESAYQESNDSEPIEAVSKGKNQNRICEDNRMNKSKMSGVWKDGQRFQGTDSTTGEHISGKVINRAGKVKGINKDCYNIMRDNDGWQGWVDFKNLRDLSLIEDETEMIILFSNNEVVLAKAKEIKMWKENAVFEEVVDVGQKVITVRWVITEKFKEGKLDTKARLVARGFEEATNNLRKDSPTCSRESIHLLFIVASSNGWDCNSIDVKSAYLQGDAIDRDIFLKPPSEFDNGNLWKLKKTVYGLCDAARAWYNRVKSELINLSVQMCTLDNSLFLWKKDGKLEGVICIYVDDFLWTGSINFYNLVIQKLKTKFLIGSSASSSFTYIGLQIKSYDDGITVDQIQYASSLTPIIISQERALQKTSQLLDSEKRSYRALVGQLNWIATHTRPDIAFDTCELSVSFPKATMVDLLKLNKLVDRVKREPLSLFFPHLQGLKQCTLECYTDAAFANLPNAGSQGAFIVFIKDEKGKRSPIFWQTRKLKRVVKSTLAAETMALLEGAEASIYILGMLKQLLSDCEIKIQCMTDNKSLYEALLSSKQVEDKRLRIDISVLDDLLARSEIEKVLWVCGANQLADALTKKGVATEKLRAALCRYRQ